MAWKRQEKSATVTLPVLRGAGDVFVVMTEISDINGVIRECFFDCGVIVASLARTTKLTGADAITTNTYDESIETTFLSV
jgi:hypothetical protein